VRASWNSIFMHQSRIMLSSTLALSFYIALVFLLVSAALLQGACSKIEKHMRGQRMRQKNSKQRRVGIIRQNVGDGARCHVRGPGCQVRVFESQVRVVERSEERSTSRGHQSQRMHSKGMYLGLQSTRIFRSKSRVFESQVRVVEGAEERSASRGYPSQRMHSKGMYLGLQGTRILVGFWRVSAASSARSEHARGWSHDICHIVSL